MNYSILGGGLAGLTSAFYLATRHGVPKVNLFEASSSFNGWCRSQNCDGYYFESAPRTLRPRGLTGNTTLELIDLLGIDELIRGIPSNRVAGKFKLSYHDKKIHSLTSDDDQKLKQLFSSEDSSDNESIYDFTCKKFDKDFADRVIVPMVKGINAGDAKQISAKFLVKGKSSENFSPNRLYEKARQEKQTFYSLQGGIEVIPNALQEMMKGDDLVELNLNSMCNKITFQKEGAELMINDKVFNTNHVISALPSTSLAKLVEHQHPDLANDLKQITAVDVATVNFHFPSENLFKEKGFGIFVQDDSPLVGIILDSHCFDMDGTVVTAILGGATYDKYFSPDTTSQDFGKQALKQIREVLKISEDPDDFKVSILKGSFPQYTIGHYQRVERIQNYIKSNNLPLSLCGQSFDGIGLNEVILSAKNAALNIQF